jgi:hypothetical protein
MGVYSNRVVVHGGKGGNGEMIISPKNKKKARKKCK